MTTNYSFSDTLPKDLGGARFGPPLIDDSTSQNDFALHRGIGVTAFGSGSIRLGYMGVATHTSGSAIGSHGLVVMAGYSEAPSAVTTGIAKRLRADKEGALYVRGASAMRIMTTASTQTHVTGSALLHGYNIMLSNVNAGNTVVIDDGASFVAGIIATAASQSFTHSFVQPILFTTSLKTIATLGAAGAASIALYYSQY